MTPPTIPPSTEWSNEKIIKFLELYETERIIWDPCDKNHKLKHKVHDAWHRISINLNNTPIDELKLKKKSLMATFRQLLKKKKSSIRSGAGADDVYQPIWFAYEIMERFLGTIYDVESTINTEDRDLNSEQAPSPSQPSTFSIPSPPEEASIQDFEMPPPSPSSQSSTLSIPSLPQLHNRPNKAQKRLNTNIDEAQIKMSQALDTLNEVLKGKNKDKTEIEDECDIYAKLLAKRLRKYPEPMRARIMYQIDGLLLQNPVDLQPRNAYSGGSSSSLSHYSNDRYQTLTPSPVHVTQTQQFQQHVYDMHPGMPDSSVQLSIPETNEIHSIPQSQYVNVIIPSESSGHLQNVSVQPSIPTTNITTQNQSQNCLNIIETAYWNATQM